jgi:hypothetical protein
MGPTPVLAVVLAVFAAPPVFAGGARAAVVTFGGQRTGGDVRSAGNGIRRSRSGVQLPLVWAIGPAICLGR